MAKTVIADSGFLVALVRQDDQFHSWASSHAPQLPPPWHTCEAAMSEAFFFGGPATRATLREMLRRRAVVCSFNLELDIEPVLTLMDKYANVPMSLADACLVRMSETLSDPIVLTTDADFRIYRRHSRQVVPCLMP
jgi:predicted nucleic acid-binding protein